MAQIVTFDEAITLLLNGAVGVLPTDTLYGLVACASNESAVNRLYKIKNREKKPGTVIAADVTQLIALGVPARYIRAVEHLWPNPLSIEINHPLNYLHQGTGRQAFRVPDDPFIRTVLEKTGPLQTTSANAPSEPSAVTVSDAVRYFGDTVDFYVDGGDMSGRKPSTIIRIIDDSIEVIRPGTVIINEYGEITP